MPRVLVPTHSDAHTRALKSCEAVPELDESACTSVTRRFAIQMIQFPSKSHKKASGSRWRNLGVHKSRSCVGVYKGSDRAGRAAAVPEPRFLRLRASRE